MKKNYLLGVVIIFVSWFNGLDGMNEDTYVLPPGAVNVARMDMYREQNDGQPRKLSVALTGSVEDGVDDSSVDELSKRVANVVLTDRDSALTTPTAQPAAGEKDLITPLEPGSSRKSSDASHHEGDDEGDAEEGDKGEDSELREERLRTHASKKSLDKSRKQSSGIVGNDETKTPNKPKPKRTDNMGGMSSFGGSIGSGVADKLIQAFFKDYSQHINAVLEKENVRLLGAVDSLDEKKQEALAKCLISCLKCYGNNQKEKKDFLFLKAKKFFIDVLLPLAVLQHLHMNGIKKDDKQIDQQLASIDNAILDSMFLQGWGALNESKVNELKTTVCGKILGEIFKIKDKHSQQKNREKIIHAWLFYFHRPLVNVTEGQPLERKKKALKTVITVIKTARYNIMQTTVESNTFHESLRDTPSFKWTNDVQDSMNASWYDTPMVVIDALAKLYCNDDARKIAQFIKNAQGIEPSGSCCIIL